MDRSNDLEFMKDYLFNAMTFEKYVYTWNNALGLAKGTVAKNENQKNKEKEYLDKIERDLSNLSNKYSSGRTDINQIKKWAFISWTITILLVIIYIYCYINNPTGLGFLLSVPALIAFLFAVAFSSGWSKYSKDNEEKEKNRLLDEKVRYTKFFCEYDAKLALASQEESKIEKSLNEANAVLTEIYSYGVLPECYRNFVSVSMMYQYIATGRCICVKGHGGIYDTYEQDLQRNLIITNLQQINAKLDQIIKNQMMLYQQMKEANSTLSSINKELQNLGESVSRIEAYSATAALAQEQTLATVKYRSNVIW